MDECSLTDEELKCAFEAFKPNKSPGFDDISSDVVKFVFDALVQPIKHIFDLSLTTGIFPDKLKVAKITPIFKSGDKELVSNYIDLFLCCLVSLKSSKE